MNTAWQQELRNRSSLLYWIGLGHFVLATTLLVAMPFDHGVVLGIDRLIKPFKFALSIGLYAWTFAWFAHYLRSTKLAKVLCTVVAATMVLEIVPITGQALLGTLSHYNFDGGTGSLIFTLMGVAIGINTVCASILLLGLCFRPKTGLEPSYLLGVRLGLALFLVGSAIGGALVTNNGHTVGAEDGGPGLPLVNWSTEAGDLRVAHAIGLHALQVIPMFAFFLVARTRMTERTASFSVVAFTLAYGAVTAAAYLQATAGKPLIG